MKYILDYRGGAKGDFLCNYINYKQFISGHGSQGHSQQNNLNLKFQRGWTYTQEYVENILSQDFRIIPAHLQYAPDFISEYFQKYDCEVIKLVVEEKYIKTVLIDLFFKEMFKSIGNIFQFVRYHTQFNDYYKNFGMQSEDEFFQKYKSAKFTIDFEMLDKNIELNNKNRCLYLENKLQELFAAKVNSTEKNTAVDNNSELYYGDIYIKYNFKTLRKIDPEFDEELYLKLLEKTWLPDSIDLFEKVWYPSDYGYRKF